MHGRTQLNSLPALKRRSSPQPATSPDDFRPPSKDVARTLASGSAGGTMPYGLPWTTPATLNSLSASLTRHTRRGADKTSEASPSRRCCTAITANTVPSPLQPSELGVNDVDDQQDHSSPREGQQLATSNADATGTTAAVRAERLKELEGYILQRAGRHATMVERQKAVQKALSLLPSLFPKLTNILESVLRYTEDMVTQVRQAEDDKVEALRRQEQKLYTEFETFFEGKIRELVVARQKAEARAEAEHAAAFAIRKERDTELIGVKEELMQRLNECEHTEEQFRDFRHLIASVFNTNQKLMLRIDQLESVLARHRIDIPPSNAEISAYKTSSEAQQPGADGGGANGSGGSGGGSGRGSEVRALSTQVPVAFMAAAKEELVKSRLTLQQELLHSAFDDHSAYRLRIEGLKRQNQDLTFHITELEEKVKDLYTYIHQRRFITQVDEYGNETTPLTPRPREVPLALQTELGIELRHSTANILTELSTVALNMKHQLNLTLLRARQLHVLSTWLNEGGAGDDSTTGAGVVGTVLQQVAEAAVIPVFPVSSWPFIPHFLRTNVSPEVRNYFWTEAQTGCILYNFFMSYKEIRARARFVRDDKMLAPRVYQLLEHRRVSLTRLDASKEDAAESEGRIPFGYVVSQFAREVLAQLSPQDSQGVLPLVLPGTISNCYPLNPPAKAVRAGGAGATGSFTSEPKSDAQANKTVKEAMRVEECEWIGAAPVVELDWVRFTYNMWYAAMRYKQTQPLCQLFTDLVDGRLPLETYDVMERVLARVQRLVDHLDSERSHRFSYPRLVNGVVRWVNDTGAQAVMRGVQAVVQSFESHHSFIHGGTLTPLALFADEAYCDYEKPVTPLPVDANAHSQHSSLPPSNKTLAAAEARSHPQTPLPGSLLIRRFPLTSIGTTTSPSLNPPPLGATVFVRYWRNFVRDTIEMVYTRIEAVLAPLVEESEVVIGLYLLSVPRAMAALSELDNEGRESALRSALFGGSPLSSASPYGRRGQGTEETLTGVRLVAEAADLLGVHGVARSFITLLESRRGAQQEKKMAERQVATETVVKVLSLLPHFKLSIHFPFKLKREVEAAALCMEVGEGETELLSGDGGMSSSFQPPSLATTSSFPPLEKKSGNASKVSKKADRKSRKNAVKTLNGSPIPCTPKKDNPLSNAAEQKESRLSGQRSKNKARKVSSSTNTISLLRSPDPAQQITKDATAEDALASNELMLPSREGELVEWYSFRHTMRQTIPCLPFLLFQPDAYETAAEAEAVAKCTVLRAFEESPPTREVVKAN
ncbi:hypothetical protein ABL78_8190 [Leptomonas seymouri]|uniref:Uncharacterized protein n=1 Tax=Leptomonas seymouri TaxID=5684 RepID=A0A0N0P2C7_LEPSE|nr:hypothetical protein ABL78_8190 [Leptomonas seymouri]|eukprot:KPI82796.1 hypothetical protein ABL78_8190 [Leptomonas seymouri]